MAETSQPSPRRLFIYRDAYSADNSTVRGWSFVVETLVDGTPAAPIFDTWEETFAEILRYPSQYADDHLAWRRLGNDELVVLEDLLSTYH